MTKNLKNITELSRYVDEIANWKNNSKNRQQRESPGL